MTKTKMKKRLRVKCILASVLLILINMEWTASRTYAGDFDCHTEVKNTDTGIEEGVDFSSISRECQAVADKIEEEVSNDSGVLENSPVEEFLNEHGVFDEEIEEIYSAEDLEEFETMDAEELDNMEVKVQYYAMADTTDEACEEDMIPLTEDEVEKYIAEKYYNEDTGVYEELGEKLGISEENEVESETETSGIDQFLQCIGIEPVTVYAESQTKQTTRDGYVCMLKKVVTCTKPLDDYADVTAVAVWEDMPKNRNLDTVALRFIYGSYEPDTGSYLSDTKVVHFYTVIEKQGPQGGLKVTKNKRVDIELKRTSYTKLTDGEYRTNSGYIAAAMQLNCSMENKLLNNGDIFIREIKKEGIRFETYVHLKSANKKRLNLDLEYIHAKTKTNLISVIASVAVAAAENSYLSAIYYGTKGKVEVTYDYSGVPEEFAFSFK